MIVTAVERRRNRPNQVDVYVDGELAFSVDRAAAAQRALRPGRPIDQPEIDALVAAEARRAAMQTAVAALARRPRSERELRQRLTRRKCEPGVADETIERLRSMKLIDDAAFARSFAETRDRTSPRGRRLIAGELRSQGVHAELAVEAAASVSEADAAYRAALPRMRSLSRLEFAAFRDRLAGHLQRRGFGWDVIRSTVRRCWDEARGDAAPADALDLIE